ncbi:hypothetical protein [Streptosporangium lutulentum]|uniref:Uncharacterized protein n=1 Tax=Streptosporangium lutulentum TaxID=1461250 RepID=A0ABT9Q9C3_9ACTN|nr:hypothetical protein [Streptosporangium lutulentum]MDP9843347.1 hypothetical protein [Streptosporangium lutulentum]
MSTDILRKRYVLAGTPGWGEHDHAIRTQGLAVVNAPRPLIGNPTWYGEWMHGRHYAAGNLDDLAQHWRADDAELLVEITPQAIVRKIYTHCVGRNYDVAAIIAEFPEQFGTWANGLSLPWDDAWLSVPFHPAPKSRDAFTRIPVCEHGVQAQAWFLQVVRPGDPMPEDLEIGSIDKDDPASLLKVKTRAAAIEGRADQFQLGYMHRDLCRTADNPAVI